MKKLILLVIMMTVTACTTTPPRAPVADPLQRWEQRQLELGKIHDWFLNGRVAIVNGSESWNLSINWQHHFDKYVLDLSGPFGAGHAQLTGTKHGVVLVDADNNHSYAESPDTLLRDKTGVRMPVNGLLYWMRGLPIPSTVISHIKLDDFGRLEEMQQDGWRIRFKSYTDVQLHELPEKIFIDGFNLKVKIFVDNWNVQSAVLILESEK